MRYLKRRPLGAERAQHLAEKGRLQAEFDYKCKQKELDQAAKDWIKQAYAKKQEQETKFWTKVKDRRTNNYVKYLMIKKKESLQNAIS